MGSIAAVFFKTKDASSISTVLLEPRSVALLSLLSSSSNPRLLLTLTSNSLFTRQCFYIVVPDFRILFHPCNKLGILHLYRGILV